MSSYLVRASVHEVGEWLTRALPEGSQLQELPRVKGMHVFRWRAAFGQGAGLSFVLRAGQADGGALLELRITPTGWFRVGLLGVTGIWLSLFCYFFLAIRQFFESIGNIRTGSLIFAAVGLAAFLFAWIDIARNLTSVEQKFWENVAQEFSIEIVTKQQQTGFSPIATLCLLEALLAGSVFTLWSVSLTTGFLVALFFFCRHFTAAFVEETLRSTYAQWKLDLARVVTSWSKLADHLVMFLCLLYYFNLLMYVLLQVPRDEQISRLKQALGRGFYLPTPQFDVLFRQLAANNEEAILLAGKLLAAKLVILVMLGLAALMAFSQLRLVLSDPKKWLQSISPEGSRSHYLPQMGPSTKGTVALTNLALTTHFAFVSLSAWVGLFLSAETILCVAGKATISKASSSLFSWVFLTPPPSNQFATYFAQFNLPAAVLLLLLCFPFGLAAVFRLLGIIARAISRLKWKGRSELPAFLPPFVGEICRSVGVPEPQLVVLDKNAAHVYSYWPVIGRPKLILTCLAASMLSEDGLRAAVAHEVAHLKLHWPRLRVLRAISNLSILYPSFLSLTIDFPAAELEADKFALSVVRDREALKLAITKVSLALEDEHSEGMRERGLFVTVRKNLGLVYKFFFEPEILGHTYPALVQRLRYLESLSV